MSSEYRDNSGEACWNRLVALKQPLLTRCERYAALTIPKVCLPEGTRPETMDESHDYQSLGSEAVNNMTNKLMIAMFAPSRPFFRVAPGPNTKKSALQAGIEEVELQSVLASMERQASAELDSKGQRPKLYQACRHLVVTGNVLMVLDKDAIRIMGIRYFCVQRTFDGRVHTGIIREQMKFEELDYDIQKLWVDRYKPDDVVSMYKHIRRTPQGGYVMDQWCNDTKLPDEYSGRWKDEDSCPYRFLTWDLADESDYGTGLVEEYVGDFESLSVLSEAIVTGAVVGTEFRWAVNPNGSTTVDDLEESQNGGVFAGSPKDIGAVVAQVAEGVKTAQAVSQEYTQRISRGFLMGAAVTRQAERVTAEEVRLQQQELQSSRGGTYSALAPQLQRPVALWMLSSADMPISATDLKIVVVTGLDALSRNGDLENLRLAFSDMAQLAQVPDELKMRIKWQPLGAFVGQGRGVDIGQFIMNDDEFSQVQQAQAAQQQAQEVSTAGGVAQAEAQAQPQGPQ